MVRKVYTARNGARYIKLANGQCRFISKQRGGNPGYELKINEIDPSWDIDFNQESLNALMENNAYGELTIDIINSTSYQGSFYVKYRTDSTATNAAGVIIAALQPANDDTVMTIKDRSNGEILYQASMGEIDWEDDIWY